MFSIQFIALMACGILVTLTGCVSAAITQETQTTNPGIDELRSRLEKLENELTAERKALAEMKRSQQRELADGKAERRKLAGRLLDGKTELDRSQKREEDLTKQAESLASSTQDLQDLMKRFLNSVKTSADRLDIHIKEIPVAPHLASQIRRIRQNLPDTPDALKPDRFLHNLRLLADAFDRTHQDACDLHVQWVTLRTADGLLEDVNLLSIGQVAFAYETPDGNRVGLSLSSPADSSGYRWTERLTASVAGEIQRTIKQIQSGDSRDMAMAIPMDITGKLRIDTRVHDKTLLQRLRAGGPVMIPLAAVAIAALLIIIERFFWLYIRNADRTPLIRQTLAACEERKYTEAEHRLASRQNDVVPGTLAACLRRRKQGTRAMEDAIQEHLLNELPSLRRFLAGLAILATVAPLLGLLGTVTGIIQTFGVIHAFGNADPDLMAGGISEALVTTATGLVIAIPILLCRGVLRGRMEKILGDAERHAATLLNMLSKDT